MNEDTFAPGFRISLFDFLILLGALISAAVLFPHQALLSGLIALVVIQFFLFCNVFRISRTPELIWAGVMVLLSLATIFWRVPPPWITIVCAVVFGAVLILREMRLPSYHGIGWQRINPGLRDWWDNEHHH